MFFKFFNVWSDLTWLNLTSDNFTSSHQNFPKNLAKKPSFNSAIHQGAGLPAASRNALESIPASSFHSPPIDIFPFHRNCTSQNHGTIRTHKASGFVNSAVRALFTILPAEPFPASTGTILVEWKEFLKPWMGNGFLPVVDNLTD